MNKQIEEMAFDLCRIDTCKHLKKEECNKTTCAHCEAEALYNAGYRKTEWISVEERLPDNYQTVLCLMKKGDFRVLEWCYSEWAWGDENVWWNERDVTHWMPLPMPPKGDDGK